MGTAGHVDHGKTALVRALTGHDTDRLPEERERGMSIELGYAPLELPGGRQLSLVDVPGHERFVRTMVAGASGVDLFLLCVAADDGVMPQTREHMAVLRRLGVTRGVVAVTRADLADPAAAAAEVAELVPGAAVVPVCAPSGHGGRPSYARRSRARRPRSSRRARGGPARLHVDRSFSIRGAGTVVTGTLWSGRIAAGDHVRIVPGGREARVRSVEVHDRRVEAAGAGQRVALNLAGIGRDEVARGQVICGPGADLEPTHILDALVGMEEHAQPLARGERLHVHHGTREAPGRAYPLESPGPDGELLVQLRLEHPLVPEAGDRFVLRRLAPADTVGGGRVLDPRARRHGPDGAPLERLRALARGETPPVQSRRPRPRRAPPRGGRGARARRPGAAAGRPPAADGERPRADGELAEAAGLAGPEAAASWRALERAGRAVRVGRNLHFEPVVLRAVLDRVLAICERDDGADIAGVRDELGTSRRYAQALLEHLDAEKLTVRRGDRHVRRRAARADV